MKLNCVGSFLFTIVIGALWIAMAGCQSTISPVQEMLDDAQADRLQMRGETYLRLLTARVQPQFEEEDLVDVIRQFQAETGIDFVARWDYAGFGDGLDPEAEMTLNFMEPAPLLAVLTLLQNQATSEETSWNLGPGYIRIGLKDSLVVAPERYIVAYPIEWLLDHSALFQGIPSANKERLRAHFAALARAEPDVDPLSEETVLPELQDDAADEIIDILTSIIDIMQWDKNGGEGGSIRYFAGALIVEAADFLHREIGAYGYGASLAR